MLFRLHNQRNYMDLRLRDAEEIMYETRGSQYENPVCRHLAANSHITLQERFGIVSLFNCVFDFIIVEVNLVIVSLNFFKILVI